ncbi:MAG TPA: SpoIVB peptidase S55 domain-containing protein [Gemmataceae bacterium]|nr:SpoIVB peptidase S55 domain-containing protein [Gemmataceae bacterium]
MNAVICRPLLALLGASALAAVGLSPSAGATPKHDKYWQVDEVRAGMKGHGLTVIKGAKIETFSAEVLGVMKNTSPGRDLVLCRLAGLDLDKTGVIAGMSGSPVYIDGKLLGAVAYAWAFGKEPIAGITPFCQMHGYVEAYERRDIVEQEQPSRVGLVAPLKIGAREFNTVTVSHDYDDPQPTAADSLSLVPLRTPLAATGFSTNSLNLLRKQLRGAGMVPMQGGGISAKVAEEAKDIQLKPGGALSVALITGDFDLSGIGTVTHIEGKRVYGWGHPFFGLGACEFPLMTGYVHAIYPRQSLSFKMGSPVRTVGVINADVSTCIAGWLGREPDMLPVSMTVLRERGGDASTFNVKVVRQRSLIAPLVFASLTNSVDMEGELPEELTAELKARIDIEGHAPVVIHDTYSGSRYSAGRAPQALYSQVASVVNQLAYNPYRPVRINKIECSTRILPGRRTADIEAVELDSETYSPGETLKATVFVRPYKGPPQRLPISLKLPADLPEGSYTARVYDDLHNAADELKDNPTLNNPQNLDQLFQWLKLETTSKRTNLVLRVGTNATGVALHDGKTLPNLPPSMVRMWVDGRRKGAQTLGGALVARRATDWVLQNSYRVDFNVTKNKRVAVR